MLCMQAFVADTSLYMSVLLYTNVNVRACTGTYLGH
jgi:hypothetical protein